MSAILGMEREVLVVDLNDPQPVARRLQGRSIAALAVDPQRPQRVYCGTHDAGLWISDDGGASWEHADGLAASRVLAVGVSAVAHSGEHGTVFAGTEPSALYRSDDGGRTWRDLAGLRQLPSAPTWSFPPKPETSHVRWITPHPREPARLLVAIEAGALVQSRDGGAMWEDRRPGGPFDSHTVLVHPDAPERVVSAAGDGFFASDDGGLTWHREEAGLPWRYCWGLAADAVDPKTLVISVAPGPARGHGRREHARAAICRRTGAGAWEVVREGLPGEWGTTLSVVVAHPSEAGRFFILNNTGLYESSDAGRSWSRLDVPWTDAYFDARPPALAILH